MIIKKHLQDAYEIYLNSKDSVNYKELFEVVSDYAMQHCGGRWTFNGQQFFDHDNNLAYGRYHNSFSSEFYIAIVKSYNKNKQIINPTRIDQIINTASFHLSTGCYPYNDFLSYRKNVSNISDIRYYGFTIRSKTVRKYIRQYTSVDYSNHKFLMENDYFFWNPDNQLIGFSPWYDVPYRLVEMGSTKRNKTKFMDELLKLNYPIPENWV